MELDVTASFLYQIRVDGLPIAKENKSFVYTIESVNSTEAGNYTCQVFLTAAPDIVRVSDGAIYQVKNLFNSGIFISAKCVSFFFV